MANDLMNHYGALSFSGMPIFESVSAVQQGTPYEVRRTWRERLLSSDEDGPWYQRPWHPLKATRWVTPMVPCCYQLGHRLIAHPQFIEQLRAASGLG